MGAICEAESTRHAQEGERKKRQLDTGRYNPHEESDIYLPAGNLPIESQSNPTLNKDAAASTWCALFGQPILPFVRRCVNCFFFKLGQSVRVIIGPRSRIFPKYKQNTAFFGALMGTLRIFTERSVYARWITRANRETISHP